MLLFGENFIFKVFPENPVGPGEGLWICLFCFLFSIISITNFAGVCLLGGAHYKQTFVFVCDQTTQAGISRGLCGNEAFLGFFSDM